MFFFPKRGGVRWVLLKDIIFNFKRLLLIFRLCCSNRFFIKFILSSLFKHFFAVFLFYVDFFQLNFKHVMDIGQLHVSFLIGYFCSKSCFLMFSYPFFSSFFVSPVLICEYLMWNCHVTNGHLKCVFSKLVLNVILFFLWVYVH